MGAPANLASPGTVERRLALSAWAALVVLVAIGLARALSLAWLCDDSFISLRYAQNLADGLGLVYNAGERVEGYTNLLWTLGLAAVARSGLSAVAAAKYAGLAFYVALAASLALHSWRRARETRRPFVPLAAALVLILDDFHVWATGGLETMMFAWLSVQALLWTRGPRVSHAWAAGAGFALAVLARPDGLLFAAVGIASFWLPMNRLESGERRRRAFATALPVGVALAVLIPAKLVYYGELLPTAFYSKSAWLPYPGQGWIYVALLLAKNWFLVPLLAVAAWAGRRVGTPSGRGDASLLVAAAALFTAYLIAVGGDFMFARRLIPVLPLVFIAAEEALSRLPTKWAVGVSLAACAAAALPLPLYDDEPGAIAGVYDERRSYPESTIEARRLQAEAAAQALAGTEVRAAFEGGMCVFGYYSELPYLAEMTGLTQYSLAKLPLDERGAIGHEKRPDAAWFADNDIHLLFKHELPPIATETADLGALDDLRFGEVLRAQILRYDPEIMDVLRERPDVRFVPIEVALERSAAQLRTLPLESARALLEELDRYYFGHAGPRAASQRERLHAIVAARSSSS